MKNIYMVFIITFVFCTAFINSIHSSIYSLVRQMKTRFGSRDCSFATAAKISPLVQFRFGGIEGAGTVDTVEEFLTAECLSPGWIQFSDTNLRKLIISEIPEGKAGALTLCAMWNKKLVETPNKKSAYLKILKKIRDQFHLTDNEIREYYQKTIADEISGIAGRAVGAKLSAMVSAPIISYYQNPSEENRAAMVDSGAMLRYTESHGKNEILRINSGKLYAEIAGILETLAGSEFKENYAVDAGDRMLTPAFASGYPEKALKDRLLNALK